jgi:hypothetical protein
MTYFRHETFDIQTTYRCKYKQKKGYGCKSRLRVYRPQNSRVIRVEVSAFEHNHDASLALNGPLLLTEETKKSSWIISMKEKPRHSFEQNEAEKIRQ